MKSIIAATLFTALALTANTVQAGEGGAIEVTTVAEKEAVVVNERGQSETVLVPVATVVPGDEVIYTISFVNTGADSANRLVITDPVPAHMQYVDGSAFAPGADVRFSVDGGNSWGGAGELLVAAPDGSQRPARPGDYTHVQWILRHPLAPGERAYARFRAALR